MLDMHRIVLTLAGCAVLLASQVSNIEALQDRKPLAVVGYHEGTRRTVRCAAGGHITGLELRYHEESWTYKESYASAVRVLCSSGKLDVEWFGELPDSYQFGKTSNKTLSGSCSGGAAFTGLHWRITPFRDPSKGGEARISGASILCTKEDGGSQVGARIDHAAADKNPHTLKFDCKDSYKDLKKPQLSKIDIWYTAKSLAGIDVMECTEST